VLDLLLHKMALIIGHIDVKALVRYQAAFIEWMKFWRRLGFTALTIGLVLIGLIVYSMLFAYR
jgi:cytochrome c biogenesis factor